MFKPPVNNDLLSQASTSVVVLHYVIMSACNMLALWPRLPSGIQDQKSVILSHSVSSLNQ